MLLFRSLAYRPFALLWAGQTISRIGDYLYQVALAWWVLEKTGSAAAMGTVMICSLAPMLVFLLIGGVAVDRLPRVQIMLSSDLARGAIVSAVALLATAGQLEVWHVLVASLLFGLVDAFFQPAYVALVPELTPRELLPSANSLTSISHHLGRVAGPLLGAAVVALGGTSGAFAFDAASFFVSAACLIPLLDRSAGQPRTPHTPNTSLLRDAREGIMTVLAMPVLWISIGAISLCNIALAAPYTVALPLLVKSHLNGGIHTLGLLYALFPVGYILGGAWLGRSSRIRRRGPTIYLALMAGGITLALFGLPVPLLALVLAALINGAALEIAGLNWMNVLQEIVPSERLGRVASVDALGTQALIPLGFALGGWATDLAGPAVVFLAGGLLVVGFSALALAHPAVRRLD
jgi:DHA3 family tetracycline resistance protein-like MFS transporter